MRVSLSRDRELYAPPPPLPCIWVSQKHQYATSFRGHPCLQCLLEPEGQSQQQEVEEDEPEAIQGRGVQAVAFGAGGWAPEQASYRSPEAEAEGGEVGSQ